MDPCVWKIKSQDPRSGIRRIIKKITVFLSCDDHDQRNLKEATVQLLNANINKYCPDIGGILMGYRRVKMTKLSQESPCPITPLRVKADFFIFHPAVGAELRCAVTSRGDNKITCKIHNEFTINVCKPDKCWEKVVVGEMIVVKVEHVSMMGDRSPSILGTVVFGNKDKEDFIEIVDVDMMESDDDTGLGTEVQSNTTSSDTSPPACDIETSSSKKRKMEEHSPVSPAATPQAKKSKVEPVLKAAAIVDGSTNKESSQSESVSKKASSQPKAVPPKPSHVKNLEKMEEPEPSTSPVKAKKDEKDIDMKPASLPETKADGEPSQSKPASKEKKTPSKSKAKDLPGIKLKSKSPSILSKILPKPDKVDDDDDDFEPEIKKVHQKSSEESKTRKTPSPTPSKKEAPEGFKVEHHITKGKKKRIILTAPNGKKIWSFNEAWAYVQKNPDYLKDIPKQKASDLAKPAATAANDGTVTKESSTVKSLKSDKSQPKSNVSVKKKDVKSDSSSDLNKSARAEKEELMESVFGKDTSKDDEDHDGNDTDSSYEEPPASLKHVPVETKKNVNSPTVADSSDSDSSSDSSDSDSDTQNTSDVLPNAQKDKHQDSMLRSSSSDSESTDSSKPTSSAKNVTAEGEKKDDNEKKEDVKKDEVFESSSDEDSDDEEDGEKDKKEKKPSRPSETVTSKDESDEMSLDEDSDDEGGKKKLIIDESGDGDKSNDQLGERRDEVIEETSDEEDSETEEKAKKKSKSKESNSNGKDEAVKDKIKDKDTKKKSFMNDWLSRNAKVEKKKEKESIFDVIKAKSKSQLSMLSSTVVGNVKDKKDNVQLPEGISPIMKAKTKSVIADSNLSYYEAAMKNSKLGKSQDDSQPSTSTSAPAVTVNTPKPGKKLKKHKKSKSKAKPGPGFM